MSLKKRRVTKVQNSPNKRRRLQVDPGTLDHATNDVVTTSTRPRTTLIPLIKKRGKDFWLPSTDLP